MADTNYNDYAIATVLGQLAQAQEAQAMRPMKNRETTVLTDTTTPYALEDLLALRGRIGSATRDLDRDLKARENFGYSLANALAGLPQQQGAGSWVSALARGFGAGYTGRTDAMIDRAQKKYEAEMKDIAQQAAIDKLMGDKKTSRQETIIGYEPMEYSTARGGTGSKQGGGDSIAGVQQNNFGRSVGYDPVENLPDFGPVTRAALSEDELGILKYVPGTQSVAKGLRDKTATKLQSTWSDISDNILSGRVLDFVGKAGGIKVADTPAEQEFIFGPIRNYQNMSKKQLQAGLKQARNNFVASGLLKWKQKQELAKSKGKDIPDITEDELKNWWNSAFSVPEGLETESMYNIQNRPQKVQQTQDKQNPVVGEVRNGIRFLGYNTDGSMKFEKVQ